MGRWGYQHLVPGALVGRLALYKLSEPPVFVHPLMGTPSSGSQTGRGLVVSGDERNWGAMMVNMGPFSWGAVIVNMALSPGNSDHFHGHLLDAG
jgi:hypothetical protein